MLQSILSFLVDKYNRVFEWFGWLYDKGRDAALYAYTWAVTEAARFFTYARQWASALFDQAKAYVIENVNWLWSKITEYYSFAISYIVNQIAAVRAFFTPIIDALKYSILSVISSISGWVVEQIDKVKAFLIPIIEAVEQKIINLIAPILPLFNPLKQLNDIFTPEGKAKILDFFERLYGFLVLFVSDPIGFILGVIWGNFVSYLCFAIAYAMGTVTHDLPPLPVWGSGGSGGGYVPGTPPPPGASGLIPPLDPVYISGYRFGAGHPGIDLGLIRGQSVFAMHAGKVLAAGWSSVGYGFYVIVDGGGWWTRYAHLISVAVSINQTISAGTVIGFGNSTGNSTGDHLHLEIKYGGAFIDPVTVL